MSLSWALAAVSAVVWVVPVVIVFRHEISARWTARHDKWFRDE